MPTEVTRRRARAAAGSSLFFALAPGVVAGLVPWWRTGWHVRDPPHWAPLRVVGAAVLVAGVMPRPDATRPAANPRSS